MGIEELMHSHLLFEELILKLIKKKEKGEQYSQYLREYYRRFYRMDIGMYSYGCFTPKFNSGGDKIIIGKYCSFAPDVRYFGSNHPMQRFSLSPFFYNQAFGGFFVDDVERHCLKIGNDVWVGCSCIITAACHNIGTGAVIGAGSVVTHDVAPYSIVAGNPAQEIKMRFCEKVIKALEESKWWELTPEQIIGYKDYFDDILVFCEKIQRESQA